MEAMHHVGFPELVVFTVVAGLLFGGKSLHELAQALAEGIHNFRGGPRRPSHPIPANDSRILNRRNRKSSADKPAI
jgi:Sec-independent protein translocase protein TatA